MNDRMRRQNVATRGRVWLGLALLALSGCASTGDVSDPAVRRLTWFSYLSGDDMHAACGDGETRLRLVHNAVFDEEVRVIEAHGRADGGFTVKEQDFGRPEIGTISFDPLTGKGNWPWRGETFEGRWTAGEAQALVAALTADGATRPLDAPVSLKGQGFFWTAAGCLDGRAWFHAWAYPSAEYAALKFPAAAASMLPSQRPLVAAHPTDPAYPKERKNGVERDFLLTATRDGIAGRLDMPSPPVSQVFP